MDVYEKNQVNVLERVGLCICSLIDNTKSAISELIDSHSDYYQATITIPSDMFYRTELICSYISEQLDESFGIEEFMMLLYNDFIRDCIINYNPARTYKMLSKEYNIEDKIQISINGEKAVFNANKTDYKEIDLIIDKEEKSKGDLILRELHGLYGLHISFDEMVSKIWISFIEDYKTGTNKRAYHDLMKILRNIIE